MAQFGTTQSFYCLKSLQYLLHLSFGTSASSASSSASSLKVSSRLTQVRQIKKVGGVVAEQFPVAVAEGKKTGAPQKCSRIFKQGCRLTRHFLSTISFQRVLSLCCVLCLSAVPNTGGSRCFCDTQPQYSCPFSLTDSS